MNLAVFEVGKPFPVAVPREERAFIELWKSGLVVMIQMPGLKREELKAFKRGFKRYLYLETDTPIPIACWVFDFPMPHGPIDVNFNSRIVTPEYITDFLDTARAVKNLITFYLLDGPILRAIKAVGLQPAAVQLFHATIRKQLATPYAQADYDRYLSAIFKYSTDELFRLGKIFKK